MCMIMAGYLHVYTCTLVHESFQHMYSLVVYVVLSVSPDVHAHIHLHTLSPHSHTQAATTLPYLRSTETYTPSAVLSRANLVAYPNASAHEEVERAPLSFSDQTLSGSGSRKEQENPNSRTFSAVLTTPLRPHREGRCMYGD